MNTLLNMMVDQTDDVPLPALGSTSSTKLMINRLRTAGTDVCVRQIMLQLRLSAAISLWATAPGVRLSRVRAFSPSVFRRWRGLYGSIYAVKSRDD